MLLREHEMSKIESIQNEAEDIRARLNNQQEIIEALFQKAKETGENPSPELMADFEKEKKNIAEINKKVDSISTAARTVIAFSG
jgi:seryl-tRNA synthetase